MTRGRGSRSVEIDCWDGDDGEPKVTHGNTLCTPCLLKDVLTALKETAFVTSDMPVSVSIEMHCGKQQQIRCAHLMRTILGAALLFP